MSTDLPRFGSLAQSVRKQELKSARGILLFVGIATVAVNIFFMVMANDQVKDALDREVQKVEKQGMHVDQAKLADIHVGAVMVTLIFNGAAAVLGVIFIVLALLIYKYPVPITITSLILYIGAAAVFGVLDPTTLAQGAIFKLIIIGLLFKAIQTALAYERETAARAKAPRPVPPCPEF